MELLKSRMGAIFVVASHAGRSSARTGIQALVRGLLYGLRKNNTDFQVIRWSNWRSSFVPLHRRHHEHLGIADQLDRHPRPVNESGSTLLLPEVIYEADPNQLIRYARKQQMRVAAI